MQDTEDAGGRIHLRCGRYRIQDMKEDAGCKIQKIQSLPRSIGDSGCIQDAGCKIQDASVVCILISCILFMKFETRFRIQDSGFRIQDSEYRIHRAPAS
jgi:hypothetical protein